MGIAAEPMGNVSMRSAYDVIAPIMRVVVGIRPSVLWMAMTVGVLGVRVIMIAKHPTVSA